MARRLPFTNTLAALCLCLTACSEHTCSIVGTWEGQAGASLLVLTFREDGEASLSVTVDNNMSTTFCRWTRVDRRICLTNTRGQVRWFPIIVCGDGTLTLRLGAGPAGLCELHRTDDS